MEQERYQIKTLIGKGRTGGVYLAEDTRSGSEVAMRRFFFQYPGDDSAWQNAFQSINPVTLHLKFPNTLPVTDTGIDEDGPFIITPYLENATKLSALINNGEKPTYPELHAITSQLLTALAAIHQAGQIHGAISPNAILITKNQDGSPSATLTDWTIGLLAENISRSTDIEHPLRDPSLTAPEILNGETPSPTSDIYTLGHTIYTLWHSGHSYAALTAEEITHQITSGEAIDIRKTLTTLPKNFTTWLHQAMNPDKSLRLQNGTEALTNFPALPTSQLLTAKPAALTTTTPTPTAPTPLPTKPKSNIPLIIAAVAILTITSVIAIIANNSSPEPTSAKNQPTEKSPPQKPNPSPKALPKEPTAPSQKITINKPKPKPTPKKPTPSKKLTITPKKPTPKPSPRPTPAPKTPTALQPITKGNITFLPTKVFTTDFTNPQKPADKIDLNHEKHYAWAVINHPDLQQILHGGATTKLAKMISISKIGDFSLTKITRPQATYEIAKQPPIPETVYAHARRNKITSGQGWRITIQIPDLGPEPLHVGIDTRSALTDIKYTVTSTAKNTEATHETKPPQASLEALSKAPILSVHHSRQTIIIEKPTPNSTITIDVTVGDTYYKNSIYKDIYSLGLNAVTIWRD